MFYKLFMDFVGEPFPATAFQYSDMEDRIFTPDFVRLFCY
jgi:hypothetical protein